AAAFCAVVVADGGVVQRERASVGNAAAGAGGVAADGGVVQRERAGVENAAAVRSSTIGDGQAGDADGGAAAHGEDAVVGSTTPVAQHRQATSPGALQVDVGAQARQGAAEVDGAGDAEGDGVVAGVGVGLVDAVAQVARQALPRPGIGQAID